MNFQSEMPPASPGPQTSRQVGDRVFRVIEVAAEDPATVRERDHIPEEFTSRQHMVELPGPGDMHTSFNGKSTLLSSPVSFARTAPKLPTGWRS